MRAYGRGRNGELVRVSGLERSGDAEDNKTIASGRLATYYGIGLSQKVCVLDVMILE